MCKEVADLAARVVVKLCQGVLWSEGFLLIFYFLLCHSHTLVCFDFADLIKCVLEDFLVGGSQNILELVADILPIIL